MIPETGDAASIASCFIGLLITLEDAVYFHPRETYSVLFNEINREGSNGINHLMWMIECLLISQKDALGSVHPFIRFELYECCLNGKELYS